jgi:hypothetical protein
MKQPKVIYHGEVIVKQLSKLPDIKLKSIKVKDDFYVVGESETHGNDHRVAVLDKPKVEFFEDANGTLYMRNTVATEIYCPNAGKHTEITIEPGEWQFGHAQEYDYEKQMAIRVAD